MVAGGPYQEPPNHRVARSIPSASPVPESIDPSGRRSGHRGAEISG